MNNRRFVNQGGAPARLAGGPNTSVMKKRVANATLFPIRLLVISAGRAALGTPSGATGLRGQPGTPTQPPTGSVGGPIFRRVSVGLPRLSSGFHRKD